MFLFSEIYKSGLDVIDIVFLGCFLGWISVGSVNEKVFFLLLVLIRFSFLFIFFISFL